MSEIKKQEMYMNNLLVNSISKEELKEMCQKAIEKYSPYNISNNLEINPFRDLIVKETIFLPEKTSVSKRMLFLVNGFYYCQFCGKEMIENRKYCSTQCYTKNKQPTEQEIIERKTKKMILKEENNEKRFEGKIKDYDYIECVICGHKAIELNGHINKIHKMECSNYKTQYNAEVVCEKKKKKVQGENNPAYQHNGRLSAWSKNFKNGYDEQKHDEFKKNQSTRMKENPVVREKNTFCREFYSSDEDYLKAQTRDLNWFQNKYGEEEGEIRWKAKTEKWMTSYKKQNFSKISQLLFSQIDALYCGDTYFATKEREEMKNYENKEYIFKTTHSYIRPDFICLQKKKIIEFDGDYWHSNSRVNPQREEKRDCEIIKQGFQVIHIKEQDFKTDPNGTIQKCINYLMV